jgi:anti-anti-sigma factor
VPEPGISTAVRSAEGGVWVVQVKGEIDLASAPELQRVLEEVARSHPSRVLLELDDVGFLDSSGLRVLVRAQRELESAGSVLVIDGVSAAARTVLEVSGLLEAFSDADRS